MTELALVGDIGGTNSRFGLVEPGSTAVRDIEVLKNREFRLARGSHRPLSEGAGA